MQETTTLIEPNPFALMMHPERVLQAMEASTHLGGLRRRVYRPLDRPLLGGKGDRPHDDVQAGDD